MRKKGEIMYPVLGKKLNWKKTGIEEEGVSLGEGKPRNRTSVILIGRGVLGGREKLSTTLSRKNGVLSAKLDENRIVFTKIDKI